MNLHLSHSLDFSLVFLTTLISVIYGTNGIKKIILQPNFMTQNRYNEILKILMKRSDIMFFFSILRKLIISYLL